MSKKITARRVILTSFFVDALDIAVNLVIMLATGSVVIASEMVQGISDLIASGLLLIGLGRPRKETYSWAIASTLIMLLVASSLSFYLGLRRFLNPIEIQNILVGFLALIISIISNGYAFILSAKRIVGKYKSFKNLVKDFRSSSFVMTKNTFVLDLMGMSAAIVGLIALILYQISGNPKFDGLGAMGIGVVLGLLSLNLLLDIKKMESKRPVKDGQ